MSNVFVFRQLPPGVINEYFGGGGKGGTTTSTQSVTIPPEVLARYNSVNARAESVAQQPFQQYGGEFVAPLTPTQVAGTQATNAAAGQAQPYYGAATALTLGGARDVGPLTQSQIGYYQNPYTQAVVNPTVQALQQQQGQQLAQQQAEAIKGGAFGGDRANLQRSQLQGQQNLALGQAIAPLYQQGYGQAVQTAQTQQGVVASDLARQMQAGQQVAGLGTGAQQASLQGAQAQLAAGQVGQQTQQAQDTAQYQQFLQERGYPFQVAQFLANIAMGTGALSGSTTSGTQTAPGGFFSDKRLKDDVREIGETHDGQPIYSYKYKGDDRTQIGLMAQDVEKKHPDAVGLMGGYKTVDYKKATEGAERTHKDMGGGLMPDGFDPNSMGGAVTSDMAGEGFERGGYVGGGLVDANDWASIVAANKQALGMYGGAQPMGGPVGATGIVPAASIPVPKPIEAAKMSMPAQRPSGMSTAMQTGKDIAGTYKGGKEFLLGSAADKSAGLIGGGGELKGKSWGGELKDWWNTPSPAATGGLIVPRHAYAGGGSEDEKTTPYDVKETMSGQDPMKDVLKSGAHHAQLMTAKGMGGPGAQSGQGGQSGIGQLASGLGTAKSLYGMGSGALSGLGELGAGFSSAGNAAGLDAALGPGFFAENIGLGAGGASAAGSGLMGSIGSGLGSMFAEMGPLAFLALKDGGRIPAYADGGLVPRQGYALQGATDVPADYSPEADMPSPNAQEAGLVVEKPKTPSLDQDPTLRLISKFEGFRDRPYWDVNALRTGFGSDTITLPNGTVQRVGEDTRVSVEDAKRDLARRAAEFQGHIKGSVGEENWGKLDPNTQAALTSVTYNYGRLPKSVAEAVQSGDKASIGAAVNALGTHNEGVNARRRAEEASLIYPEGKYSASSGPPRPPMSIGDAAANARNAPSSGAEGKKSIGDVVTSEGFIVPALGFLGSMLASNKPNLGQALGEGIMGGVGAYQSQRKMAAELPKIEAATKLELANVGRTDMMTRALKAGMLVPTWQPGVGLVVIDKENPYAGMTPVTDADGKPLPGNEKLVEEIQKSGSAPAGTPGAKPGAVPAVPVAPAAKTSDITQVIQKPVDATSWTPTTSVPKNYIPANQANITMRDPSTGGMTDAAKGAYDSGKAAVGELEAKARNTGPAMVQLQQIIQEYNSLPETGLLSPGAGATQRYALIDKANAALRAIGAEPIDRNSAGAVEAINKGTFSLGATLANSIGTREPGYIVSQAVKNSPGIEMSKKGFELVSSGLKQNAEYSNDRARFFRDYLSKFQHLDGAQEAFDHANPPEMYAKRAILTTIPADEKNRFVEFVRKNGEKYPNETRTTIQNFEREHSKGSAALVLGR